MSPFSNANPIFAVKWSRVVRTFDSTSPSKSHFGWETTHCGSMALKFDYFGGISCSWNLLFPCARSLWFTVACRWIPSSPFKTSILWTGPAKPWPRYQRLSFLDVVRVTLARYQRWKTSTVCWGQFINFLRRSCKVSTRLWVLTCLALGEPSLQLAASNLPLTNKPTLHE